MERATDDIGRRRRGRPSLVTREEVLRAGLSLVNREGLDALTMGRVAGELGVGVMTLYRHVADKADLLAGMVDLVVAEEAPPPEPVGDWRQRCATEFRRLRSVLLRHPALAGVTLQRAAAPRPQD